MKNQDYSKEGNHHNKSDMFWERQHSNIFSEYERQWNSYIDRLYPLAIGSEEAEENVKKAILLLNKTIDLKRSTMIEEGDKVTVDLARLQELHEKDVLSAHYYLHIREELNESRDGTLTVFVINANEATCYGTLSKSTDLEKLGGPLMDGDLIKLHTKKDSIVIEKDAVKDEFNKIKLTKFDIKDSEVVGIAHLNSNEKFELMLLLAKDGWLIDCLMKTKIDVDSVREMYCNLKDS